MAIGGGIKFDKATAAQLSEELQHICKILNIDSTQLQPRSLQEFINEDGNEVAAKVKYEHYEKRRKVKMKFVQEFMLALKKKSRQGGVGGNNMVCLSLLPKESILELKKSKLFQSSMQSQMAPPATQQSPEYNTEGMTRFANSAIQRSRSLRQGYNHTAVGPSTRHLAIAQSAARGKRSIKIQWNFQSKFFHKKPYNYCNMNQDLQGNQPLSLAQSMKQQYMKSLNSIFGLKNGGPPDPSGTNETQTDEDKEKAKKIKIPFYELNQEEKLSHLKQCIIHLWECFFEERQIVFRIKSAKQEKKLADEQKNKKEVLEWKAQQRHEKMDAALRRKRMQDNEEEAKREKKLADYNKKALEIQQRIKTLQNNYTSEAAMSESHGGGLSGLDEYEGYGSGSGGVDYSNELEIQEKIRQYEEKMMRATLNRQNKLQDFQEKLQYQNQIVREKVTHAESSDNQKEYESLNRYCDRQVKSRKFIKKKTEDRQEHVMWKKQKDEEVNKVRKMRIKDKFQQEMSRLQQQVTEYQERWHQTGFDTMQASDFDNMSDSEIGKRVKRTLRMQDQAENMKRILSQQKQYKMLLVQDLLVKDRKVREFSEYRKSVATASMNTLRNNYSSFGGAAKSQQAFSTVGNTIQQ